MKYGWVRLFCVFVVYFGMRARASIHHHHHHHPLSSSISTCEGDLTPEAQKLRRVVALFNKGEHTEILYAPASLYTRSFEVDTSTIVHARDVVARKDVPLQPGEALTANVPSHGVSLFVLTFSP